jgi:hypothetical protein
MSYRPSTWSYRQAREPEFGWLVLMDGEYVCTKATEDGAARMVERMTVAEAEAARLAATEVDPEVLAFRRGLV